MTQSPTRRIAGAFAGAVPTYDQAAKIQRQAAGHLADYLSARAPYADQRVLEIGCGTGFLSRPLATTICPQARDLIITDIAEPMLAAAKNRLNANPDLKTNLSFQLLDGQQPDITGEFDLITSSMTFQWFEQLETSVRGLTRLLSDEGRLVFLTLGENSLRQWRAVHDQLDIPCATPRYPRADALPGLVREWEVTAQHPHGMSFLRDLKAIGAHRPRDGRGPLPPPLLRTLIGALDHNSGPVVEITYHFLLFDLSKKDI